MSNVRILKNSQHVAKIWIKVVLFLPRTARSASAVLLSYVVRPSITSMYAEHVGWTSSKLITRIISLGSLLLGATTSAI